MKNKQTIKKNSRSPKQQNITAIILAAGRGTRMKSEQPKALCEISQRPMVEHIIGMARLAGIKDIVVIGGYKIAMLEKALAKHNLTIIKQERLLGSADAVRQASSYFSKGPATAVVLYADTPLIRPDTIKQMLRSHSRHKSDMTLLTAFVSDAKEYGRIMRNSKGSIHKISEHADLQDKKPDGLAEINVGAYCFDAGKLFEGLRRLKKNDKKGEYYLTDIVEYFCKNNYSVGAYGVTDTRESLGVNTRQDAIMAEGILRQRAIEALIEKGVIIKDPAKVYISEDAVIGAKTIIYPFVVIEKGVIIESGCRIGPFAHIRSGTRLEQGALVGNYVEVNRSVLGRSSRAKHHSYLGDAIIGRNVNIGAGTITANYDGKKKSKTIIQDNAFIGSGTTIIAPVDIGKGSITGAGSVVLKNTKISPGDVFVGVPARRLKK
jgi:bifunctional UDP-N-acetylglucosamine pyrophosphorylase / glucosamine-1-phosphate N-acetyltransferase